MKKLSLLASFIFLLSFNGTSQIPVSTSVSDQIVLGPCYIFATVAALESKALENQSLGLPNSVNFYEWNMYSVDVLGGRSGSPNVMVPSVLNHAASMGVHTIGSNTVFTVPAQLPNLNDVAVPGIADFTGNNCNIDFSTSPVTYLAGGFEGNCFDDDNNSFMDDPLTGAKFIYQASGTGYIVDNSPTEAEMKNHLDQGRGLIACFTQWNGESGGHAVFVYNYNGDNWSYKDSYPGQAGNKTGALDISTCSSYYYLTGSVVACGAPPTCQESISGPSQISGNATYTLSNNNGISNVSWSTSTNLTIVSSNGNTVQVSPRRCRAAGAYVLATYTDNGVSCQATYNINILGNASTPSSILVFSPNWDNGETCPNETLELNVLDNNYGPPHTNYEWSVSGATITSGQGTPVVMVQASGNIGAPLVFKVRARNGNCPWSAWRTLTGRVINCGGTGGEGGLGGGHLTVSTTHQYQSLVVKNTTSQQIEKDDLHYQVITLDGRIKKQGRLQDYETTINLEGILDHLVLLRIYSSDGTVSQVTKHFRGLN